MVGTWPTGARTLTSQPSSGYGRLRTSGDAAFNGVKVFSATMVGDRDNLGEKITDWLAENPHIKPRDAIVTQSSDEAFHCIAITIFYWEEVDR